MPMDEKVKKQLGQTEPTAFHASLLAHCVKLVDDSRSKMNQYYAEWDRHDDIYRGNKPQGDDKTDRKTTAKNEPKKMVVPISHSQIQTFVAFGYSLLFQREHFFELVALEPDMERSRKIGEALLQRDLDYNNAYGVVYQALTDMGRFGICVGKCSWVEETQMVDITTPEKKFSFLGMQVTTAAAKVSKERKIKYQGNKISNVSPYRFFPDHRLPLTRFQEGEFCASEDEYGYATLKQMEVDGLITGVDAIMDMQSTKATKFRQSSRLSSVGFTDTERPLGTSKGNCVVTEIEVKLVPKSFMLDDGTPMGPEDYPIKYLVWYANDNRIIRCEPLSYNHDQFTFFCHQYTPDIHRFISEGIAGVIEQLQDVITWFINSHITSVRRVMQNVLIVDPGSVEMEDLRQRRPVIRMKPGVARLGMDRFVHQLQLQDVTQNHMADSEMLQRIVQMVTGVNDNALGQFYKGRRSAQEARNVSSGTASRLKMAISLFYYGGLKQLGSQMLSNLRQGLTAETFVRVFGLSEDPSLLDYMQFAKVSNADLVGDFDFAVFDGTLPSEKFYAADTLQELFTMLASNPVLMVQLGYDLGAILTKILELRGINHPQQFKLSETQKQLALQQMMMAESIGQQQTQQPPSSNGKPPAGQAPGVQRPPTPGAANGTRAMAV